MNASVRVEAFHCYVRCPFEFKDIPKGYPGSKWMPAQKEWRLDATYASAVARALQRAGCTVFRDGAWPKPDKAPAVDWAHVMLTTINKVSPQLAAKAYTALVRVLHPDTGGDTRLMQQLNDARASVLDRPR